MENTAQKPLPFLAKGMAFSSQHVAAVEDYSNREFLSSIALATTVRGVGLVSGVTASVYRSPVRSEVLFEPL